LQSRYDPSLVTLSILIACLASYVSLDLAGRVTAAAGRARRLWLAFGALAMGIGIWSMHFVGMLAYRAAADGTTGDLPTAYDVPRLLLSVLVAVVASGLALAVVGRPAPSTPLRLPALTAAGLLMGAAIAGMHYIGMWAMHVPAAIAYAPTLVVASVVVAVGASFAALWLAFRLRAAETARGRRLRASAAVVMGVAIAGMHYTAMAAVHLGPSRAAPLVVRDDLLVATSGLTVAVAVSTLAVLALALLGAALDRWLRTRLSASEEHARLYRVAEAARAEAEQLATQLREQAEKLERRVGEAQVMTAELERANAELEAAVAAARESRDAQGREHARLRAVLDTFPDAASAYDREWRWTYMNPVARQRLAAAGRDPDALVGRRVWDELPELLATRFYAEALRAVEQGRVAEFEETGRAGRWLEHRIVPVPDGAVTFSRDVTERQLAAERERFLAEASRVLATSLDYATTLQNVAQLAVPTLADWCGVDVRDGAQNEAGELRQLAVAHVAPSRVVWARELRGRYPPRLDAPSGTPAVARTGRAEFYPAVTDEMLVAGARDPEHLRIMREIGFSSVIIAPLVARGRTFGALTLVSAESRRRFTEADLALAEEVGRRAGLAIDNAGLFAAEQRARSAAEVAADRIGRLQAVTAALAQALTPPDVADAVIAEGAGALGASDGIVCLTTSDGASLEIVHSRGLPEETARAHRRFPLDAPLPLAEVVRRGEPLFLESREAIVGRYPALAGESARIDAEAWALLPLVAHGRVLGALAFGFGEARAFDVGDRAFIDALARQCAQALERASLYEAERRAREAAEAAAGRATALQAVANVLVSARTADEAASAVLRVGVPAVGATRGSVALLADDGRALDIAGAVGYPDEAVVRYRHVPLDAAFPLADAARTGEPLFLESASERDARYPHLAELRRANGDGAMAALPLASGGRAVGVLGFNFPARRVFVPEERAFLNAFAQQTAQALERVRLDEAERRAREAAEQANRI
jgi:PAS domain S-box-containing protein